MPYDHHAFSHGWTHAYFECKAIEDGATPMIPIDVDQVGEYLSVGLSPLYYVLPVAPTKVASPENCVCKVDGCCDASVGHAHSVCRCCPRDSRVWTHLEQHYTTAPPVYSTQPWFSHWAWTVAMEDLQTVPHIAAKLAFGLRGAVVGLPATDKKLGSLPGATRLCHLLGAPTWYDGFSVALEVADSQLRLEHMEHLHLVHRHLPGGDG